MTLQARGYQIEAKAAVLAHFAQEALLWALVVSATGTGKTVLAHLIIGDYLAQGKRVLWLAHRAELVEQAKATCVSWFPGYRAGLLMQGANDIEAQAVYASKDTIRQPKRLAAYLAIGYPDLIVVDEAHHSTSATYRKLLSQLIGPGTKVLGLTATPDRNDAENLSTQWAMVYNFGIMDGIACNALVPPFAALDLIPGMRKQMAGVSVSKGEYNAAQTEDVLLRNHIIKKTVEAIEKTHHFERLPLRDDEVTTDVRGMAGLVFTVTVQQAKLTAEALIEKGYRARYVWGEMADGDRKRIIDAFRAGDIDILVNAGLLTEGTDLPRAKWAVLARPTRSWTLFVQIVGRILRPFGDHARAYIIDLCGATQEHSIVSAPVLVDGIDCEESHDGRHRYLPIEGCGAGRCQDCGVIIKCIGNGGSHFFPPKAKEGKAQKPPHCKFCGEAQCPLSPDHGHHWVAWDDNKRKCTHCAMEIPDALSAMVARELKVKEDVAWKQLDDTPVETWAVNLGKFGYMFNVFTPDGVMPFLYARDQLTKLAPRPVRPEMARLLTDDVARRTVKTKGFYGGQPSASAMRISCIRAEALVKKLRPWEHV